MNWLIVRHSTNGNIHAGVYIFETESAMTVAKEFFGSNVICVKTADGEYTAVNPFDNSYATIKKVEEMLTT